MGWIGPVVGDVAHEGWIVPLFADGAEGNGTTSSRGVLVADAAEEWRPDAAVIGYAAGCTCGWRGRSWTRVHSAAAAGGTAWHRPENGPVVDSHNRLIFQPGGSADLDGPAERPLRDDWHQHTAPWTALEAVTAAAARQAAAARELYEAVEAARTTGASWADIGRAAGMSRQAANERWARFTAVVP